MQVCLFLLLLLTFHSQQHSKQKLMAFNMVESALSNLRLLYQNERDMMIFVDQEMKKLESNLSAILSLLHDAEAKQIKGTSRGIDDWLQKLDDAVLVLEDIVDDCLTEAMRDKYEGDRSCSFLSFLHPDKIKFRHNISGRMKEIREQLDLISQEKRQFNLVPFLADATAERHGSLSLHNNIPSRRATASAITEANIFGREDDKSKIVSHLLEDGSKSENLTVHTIWGMGGLGKTTLAQLVYNEKKVQDHFELKIWICVSENFELETLIKAIIGSPQSHDHLDSLQNQLRGKLGGKRYLLVLDDVWNDDQEKWDHLRGLLSCGSKGSAVLATTRQLKIATIMRTPPVEPYRLAALSDEDCWQIFRKRAFGLSVVQETGSLVTIGKEIARKCGGVPLAAKALGGLLSFTSDENRWAQVSNSDLWNLSNLDDSIMGALKLSYLNLPTRYRRCFSFCALFFKDYSIRKEKIIHLWIANGLIPSEGVMSTTVEVDDIGDEIIHELHWRSLIDDIQMDEFDDIVCFKMHDLVHDMAHTMMGNVVSNLTSSELLHPGIRHVIPDLRATKCEISESLKNVKYLRTYIGLNCPLNIVEHTSLRALCLEILENGTELLPRIHVLKHLRYLNLSYSKIEELPESICSLWNLQILILDSCDSLKTLPNGMGCLESLRHLYTRRCGGLSNMPKSMGHLTSLRTLSVVIVGEGENVGFQLSALSQFKYLKGEMEIRNLERVTEVEHAQKANLMEKSDLDRLALTWMEGVGDAYRNRDSQHETLILEALRPSPKLKSLMVKGYGGARFPAWMMDDIASFRYIQFVSLSDCRIYPQLPPLWRLPCLKRLGLKNLGSVRYLIEAERETYGNEGIRGGRFSSLEELALENLGSLEAVVMPNDDRNILIFPRLSRLTIRGCPRFSAGTIFGAASFLRYLSTDDFGLLPLPNPRNVQFLKCLEGLAIANSDSLEFFPANQMLRGMSSIKELSIVNCRKLKYLDEVDRSDALAHLDTPRFPVLQLRHFILYECENLECLPDWLGDAMSMEFIGIVRCPKLTCIPNYFRRLTNLKELHISYCPELTRRCRKEIGEDWDNVAHVPVIFMDGHVIR